MLSASWDIDLDGNNKPLEDGLMFIRSVLGFADSTINDNAITENSVLTTDTAISDRARYVVEQIGDIDGSGEVTATEDGALLLRYLFNLDTLLTDDINLPNTATRNTDSAIRNYIQQHD